MAFDLTGCMPFDRDANDQAPAVLGTPDFVYGGHGFTRGPFLYDGRGFTPDAFPRYVQSYNFGRILPSYIVLHHTAIPSTLAARFPSGALWDDNERGLSAGQVYTKRKKQVDNLRDFYRDRMGWDRGPHLFIDDKYIWTFTPMSAVGIHAKEGNSYTDAKGKLHYSIGIEVLGYYEHVVWPDPVAANVRVAVTALCTRLDISPTYRPGPPHTPSAHAGSLSSHRDFNKPACPGAAITEAYYTSVIAAPASRAYRAITCAPIFQDRRPDAPLAGAVTSGTIELIGDVTNGWLWLVSGLGFSPASCWEVADEKSIDRNKVFWELP